MSLNTKYRDKASFAATEKRGENNGKKNKQTPPPLRSKSKACLRLKLDQDRREAPCSDLVTRKNIGLQGGGQECGERPQWRHRHTRMG